MAKLFDANGNEVEAYTEDELKAKQDEAVQNYLKENPDKSDELKTAQDALAVANNKLKEFEEGKGGGEETEDQKKQKERLKTERDEALAAVEEVTKTLTKEISDLKTNFIGGNKSKVLSKLAGGDAELLKKLETEYDGFAGEANTEEEIVARASKAFTIVKGTAPAPNFMDGMSNGTDRGVDQQHGTATQETDNAKNMRKVFGITDQDAEKYAPKQEGQS